MHFTNFYNQDLKDALDENFSNIVTENVGPFIYSTIKTIRPRKKRTKTIKQKTIQ